MKKWKKLLFERFAPYLLVLLIGLALLLNSVLVTTIQAALDFPHQRVEEVWPDHFDVLDAYGHYDIHGQILWVDNAQWHLLITEKHFKLDRWRTVCDITLTEQNFSGEFPVQGGKVAVQLEAYDEFAAFEFHAGPVYKALKVPGDYLLWNGGLLILEIAVLLILRKLKGT